MRLLMADTEITADRLVALARPVRRRQAQNSLAGQLRIARQKVVCVNRKSGRQSRRQKQNFFHIHSQDIALKNKKTDNQRTSTDYPSEKSPLSQEAGFSLPHHRLHGKLPAVADDVHTHVRINQRIRMQRSLLNRIKHMNQTNLAAIAAFGFASDKVCKHD
ncbi:hypothetical protein NEIMUCOT_03762 [Neisseria mucosa ATCC 25996]|uniref:Uncharacterized protein n=1 Tax=Neisseria mucosa (strain ATCC 25996 / DSM 4631 / NCTC 10774 / M26) TaxID=546266 RepID=D2ZT29_NEIM2|nr:hypothetical protein NEIMUCOT_03762 [Neisseria mucosa ATCC 25996]